MPRWMNFPRKVRGSGKKMVYVHGEQRWAFRVEREGAKTCDVVLIKILSGACKRRSLGDDSTVLNIIIESTQAQRKDGHKPVVNMNRFESLIAIDGVPGKHKGSVARVFEETFKLGFLVGEGNDVSARQTKSLNDYTRELMGILEPSGLFGGDGKVIHQTLQSVYRLGIWAADF